MPTSATFTSVVFETLHRKISLKPLLLLVPGLLEPAVQLFLTPALIKSAPSQLLKRYKPLDHDPLFRRADPTLDSVTVAAVRKSHAVAPPSSVSLDKESKQMDSVGRKMCGTSASTMKAASATAVLGRYDRSCWDYLGNTT